MQLIVIGCVTGVFLVFTICIIVIVIISRRRSRRGQDFARLELPTDPESCKSAPASRQCSPKLSKRYSSPNLYGTLESVVVPVTPSRLLPPVHVAREHVQPDVHDVHDSKSKSTSALQYQNRFVASMQEQIDRSESGSRLERSHSAPTSTRSHGRVWFTVFYDVKSRQLTVTLVKVTDLTGRNDEDDTRDPFVKVFLLPDEHTCRTSKVMKKTLNPVFNQRFLFDIGEGGISHRSVRFSVYDVDKRRVRHSLGHVKVPLQEIDLNSSVAIAKDLEPDMQSTSSTGEINLGLTYQPQLEKLKVVILRTRHIRTDDVDASLYVNLHLYYGPKLLKTKQTLTHRNRTETSFNESFSFSTTSKHIDSINFRVTLMQRSVDELSDDVEIGHVCLGAFMFARGSGLIHWQEMMSHTRTVVTRWHQLMVHV